MDVTYNSMQYPQRPREGIRFPGARVKGRVVSHPVWVEEPERRSSARTSNVLNL